MERRLDVSDDIETRRAANRAQFPAVAQIVDEFRAVFGPGVKAQGGVDSTTGKSFGDVSFIAEREACRSCRPGDECKHPRKEVVFCGHRRAAEAAYLLGKSIEAGKFGRKIR